MRREILVDAMGRRTVFDVNVDVYLMQNVAHVRRANVGEHDELYGCKGFVVV